MFGSRKLQAAKQRLWIVHADLKGYSNEAQVLVGKEEGE